MVLYGDNDTATARARERKLTVNDRHVALKYHTTRDWVEAGEIEPDRVGTKDNHTDIYTKATSGIVMSELYLQLKGYAQAYMSEKLLISSLTPAQP